MPNPKYSVVIPTRGRVNTLQHSLKTCLVQNHEDYEVLVADNSQGIDVAACVASFGDPRVRLITSRKLLSMSDNWDYAVGEAKGEYLILIGDDDGLMPDCLNKLDSAISIHPHLAIRWESITYRWPQYPKAQSANHLRIPFGRQTSVLAGTQSIRAAANYQIDYAVLPMLYNSAIHRSLVEQLRKRTGRVFKCGIPDVYSGFAFAYLSGTYLSMGCPLGIGGLSSDSNGSTFFLKPAGSEVTSEFLALSLESDARVDKFYPYLRSMPVLVAEAFEHAKENVFPHEKKLSINKFKLIRNFVHSLQTENTVEWHLAIESMQSRLGSNPALRFWLRREADRATPSLIENHQGDTTLGFKSDSLVLDAMDFGCQNVFDVSVFCYRLLGRSGAVNAVHAHTRQK